MNLAERRERIFPWLIMLCCCAQYIIALGLTNYCLGIFFAPVADELGTGIGNVSIHLTLVNFLSGISGVFAVKMLTHHKQTLFLLISAIMSGGCFLSLSSITELWQLYVLSCVLGIANGFYSGAVSAVFLGQWFRKRMGMVLGICISVSGLSGTILGPILQMIIDYAGWRTAYRCCGIMAMLMLVPTAFIMTFPHQNGLKPFGMTDCENDSERVNMQEESSLKITTKSQRTKLILLICIVQFIGPFITGFGTHIHNYALTINLTAQTGAYMVSAVMIGNTFAKFFSGMLSDRIGPAKVSIMIFSVVVSGMILLLLGSSSISVILLASGMMGTIYGVGAVMLPALIKELFGLKEFSVIYSWVMIIGYVGSGSAYAGMGYLYDMFGNYVPVILTCSAMAVLGIVIMLAIPVLCRQSVCMKSEEVI